MSKSPGHQQHPDHKVRETHLHSRATAAIDGQAIAESSDVIRVDEDGAPPRYYFPRDAWYFQAGFSHGWNDFRAAVDAVFGPEDVVWDMNTPAYDYIRRKGEAYSDGHVSQIGAALVLAEIQRQLDAHLPLK